MHQFNVFKKAAFLFIASALLLATSSCSSNKSEQEDKTTETPAVTTEPEAPKQEEAAEHGIGPVSSVDLGEEIDQELANKGEAIFSSKCIACHTFDQRIIGPPLNGVTERRNPAWIMNMILNPTEMTQKDPIAKALLEEYNTQMVNMNVTEEDARAILEYFRLKDKQG